MARAGEVKDIAGQVFGRLTVLRYAGQDKHRKALWECSCSCGNTTIVCGGSLRSRLTKSCGCFQKTHAITHGKSRSNDGKGTSEYKTWASILSRCNNPHAIGYQKYGGRGIKVCIRWLRFESFLADIGPRPTSKHSIDRVNNDGNYEPGNCRWALKRQQDRNRRTTRLLTLNGETCCITEWAERLGVHPMVITWRIANGWPLRRALTTPSMKGIKRG